MKQWYATVPRKKKRLLFVMAALFPLFMWLMVYMLIPIFSLVINSFTNAHMAYPDFKFVGLYQFKKMFGDSTFITALKNTVVAVLFIVPTTLVLSTLTASGLNSLSRRWRELYTFVYFVPSILSMTAICLVWRWLYNANYGLINAFLNLLGLPSQGFIQDSKQALISMCVIQVWAIFGYYAVIILANMRAIDSSLFEAADIDGANSVSKFIYITVPMLRNTFLFVMIMATTTAFMFFTPVQILTDGNGSPGTSTMVLLLYIMKKGISQSNVGYASAISLILLLTILFFSLVQWLLTRERKCKIPKTDCVSLKEGDENE
jgi:ABC-type sugar transport system permease subunit